MARFAPPCLRARATSLRVIPPCFQVTVVKQESPSRGQIRQEQFQLVKNTLQQQRVKTAANVRPLLERIDIDKIALTLFRDKLNELL